jgi:hypothetical protein
MADSDSLSDPHRVRRFEVIDVHARREGASIEHHAVHSRPLSSGAEEPCDHAVEYVRHDQCHSQHRLCGAMAAIQVLYAFFLRAHRIQTASNIFASGTVEIPLQTRSGGALLPARPTPRTSTTCRIGCAHTHRPPPPCFNQELRIRNTEVKLLHAHSRVKHLPLDTCVHWTPEGLRPSRGFDKSVTSPARNMPLLHGVEPQLHTPGRTTG